MPIKNAFSAVPSGDITVAVKGLDTLTAKLAELRHKLTNTQELMETLANELLNSSVYAFKNQCEPDGTPWKPWSEGYKKSFAKKDKATDARREKEWQKAHPGKERKQQSAGSTLYQRADHKLLFLTGELFKSLTPFASNTRGGVGSTLVYARIHQLGGGSVRPGYPERPFLGASQKMISKIPYLLKQFITEE